MLALFGAILALCVVVLGAYVRLSDAGLGCPDWPGCYGSMTVPQSEHAIQQAQLQYPNKVVAVGKAWKEMLHRYVAGTLGLLVLALCIFGWKEKNKIKSSPWLSTGLVFIITFQAILGMWTVTMLLKPVIVSSHLLGGMTTLAILVWIAHRHWGHYSARIIKSGSMRFMFRFALVIIFMQVLLGGWTSTNYAALACTDFPMCHGVWLPEMNFKDAFHVYRELGQNANGSPLTLASITAIQWTHRIGALVTFIYLGALALSVLKYWQLRHLGVLLIIALCIQVSLGVANLVLHLPLAIAVAHNMMAAILVMLVVILNSKITGYWK